MLEFADTCKIRVLDNDETFVLDEVRYLRNFRLETLKVCEPLILTTVSIISRSSSMARTRSAS